jgi:hypothetical protein
MSRWGALGILIMACTSCKAGETQQLGPREGVNAQPTPPTNEASECSAGALTGQVLRLRGRPVYGPGESAVLDPIAGVAVTASHLEGGRRYVAATDEDGRYRFCIPPGRYRIELSLAPGWWTKDVPRMVEVRTGHEVSVDIRFESGIR